MKITILLLITSLILLAFGCRSKKAVSKTNEAVENVQLTEKMIAEGYKMGTIHTADGGCPFVIDIDDDNFQYDLDPINLEDDFKQDGLKIWFKFTPLRMKNRCENTNPIKLSDIQKREG